MERKSLRILLLLSFLIILIPSRMVFSQFKVEEERLYKIEIDTDGSAAWTIERRFFLEPITYLQVYMSQFDKEEYLQEFSNNTQALVTRASMITGRSMRAENFAITVDIVNTTISVYGMIKTRYDWIGFAKVEEKRIMIGDVFEGGTYLSRDDALVIEYPSNYVTTYMYPEPDDIRESERTLAWYGRRTFGAGQPTVTLEERTQSIIGAMQKYVPLIVSIIAVAGISSAALWFFKFKKKEEAEIIGPPPRVSLGIKDDEEKVVTLLQAAGGRLYQSTIAKQCGFSRSKTSELLTTMEKKGIVTRQKKGRQKVVTLTNETKDRIDK